MIGLKDIYVIRHCKAEGQVAEAPLTEEGFKQAESLATFFNHHHINVERIISSPFKRAVQTIQPLAEALDIKVEENPELKERVLSSKSLPDWREKLKNTFDDPSLKLEGGESSEEAAHRIVGVVEDISSSDVDTTVMVTHGNLMSLLLNHYEKQFGFEEGIQLTNPDIYLLRLDSNDVTLKRIELK